MIRNLVVSIGLIGFGVLIGIFLPISPANFNEPLIEFDGYEGLNEFTGEKTSRLRVEFRESMVVARIDLNEGDCRVTYDTRGWSKRMVVEQVEFPLSAGFGTVIDLQTDCEVLSRIRIDTDKGLFDQEFPSN